MGYSNPMNSINSMGYINYMQPTPMYNNYEYEYFQIQPQTNNNHNQNSPQQQASYYDDFQELQQMRRSFDFMNLVETKKSSGSGLNRLQSKGFN